MAAAIFVETTAVDRAKRTRKTHHKVKTGCATCKQRRKKCGEERPFCLRCTSTGRRCDGYEVEMPPVKKRQQDSVSPDSAIECTSVVLSSAESHQRETYKDRHMLLQLWRPPNTNRFSSEHDYYCFDFFRNRTGPEFAAYFDSSIWRTFMIRACYMHHTVLQAAAAVGAVHRRFELGISREAFEFCKIATKQYQKAIKCLQEDLDSGHPNAPEINMIVSMLLSIFETFQGNYDSALSFMSMGLKQLMNRAYVTTHSQSQYKSADVSYANLHKLVHRLEQRAPKLFGSQTQILQKPDCGSTQQDVPHTFENLEQARDILITESRWIWDAWIQLELGTLQGFSRQHAHISRLLEWSMAYAEYSKTDRSRITPENRQAAQLLIFYRETLYLVILTQIAFHDEKTGAEIIPLCRPPEKCQKHSSCRSYAERRSVLNAHFARLLIFSQSIFDSASYFAYEEHSLSVDSGIGPPLYLGSTDYRSTKVRHQVTSLLKKSHLQKKVWDTLGVYTIAEKLSSLEEHAVTAACTIPGALKPKWVDITYFLEESKILLRYCRQDDLYGGLIWTQQWLDVDTRADRNLERIAV